MKKNIFVASLLTTVLVATLLLVSCYKLDPRDNKFDPGGTAYVAPTNTVTLRGWKIDTAVGDPASPSLRCVNIKVGQSKVIRVDRVATGPGATFTIFDWKMKAIGVSGPIEVTVAVSNMGTTVNQAVANVTISSDIPSFSLQTGPLAGNTTVAQTWQYYFIVRNNGDTDGSNTVWIDNVNLSGTGTWPSPFDFSGVTDGQLIGGTEVAE